MPGENGVTLRPIRLDLREAEVRHADITGLARSHDVVEGAHRLLERRVGRSA
jgi:hypothetical protein